MRKIASVIILAVCWLFAASLSVAMSVMDDEQLSDVVGQALIQSNKRVVGSQPDGSSYSFYSMGFDAEISLNTNIKKLQLGCGGVNGAGCDIDIDNMSLSGNCGSRPDCDAVLRRPFIELAIKGDNNGGQREVVGFRVSAEAMQGLLTFGNTNSTTPNGINAFSGYMKAQSDSSGLIKGYASTSAAYFNAGTHVITGAVDAPLWTTAYFKTVGGGFNVPALSGLPFSSPGITVNSRRITSVPINTSITLPTVYMEDYYPSAGQYVNGRIETMGGPVDAEITGCSGGGCALAWTGRRFSGTQMHGSASNITANVTINQSLGYIHKVEVNSPFYISFQKSDTKWPNAVAADVAKRGWWMSLSDPVTMGDVNPVDPINVAPVFPQLASAISSYLASNHASTSDLGAMFGFGNLDVNVGNINLAAYPLTMNLSNLQISGQNFNANCRGSARVC